MGRDNHWEAYRPVSRAFSRSPGQHLPVHCRAGSTSPQTATMYDRNILIEQTDPELFAAIQAENARQEHHIELIASENYASPAVMAAQGTQLTNKYAEGYPGRRYYGGCEYVDIAEQLAIDRVKQIFG